MELADFYPSADVLIESELSVLNHLRQNRYIKEKHPQVANDAEKYYHANRVPKHGFEFNSHFDVFHTQMPGSGVRLGGNRRSKPNARLIVSARIDLSGGALANVSYCLTVCRIQGQLAAPHLSLLRKFHFDVVASRKGTGKGRQEHPRCHLQYCGEMVPYLRQVGCRKTQLDHMHPGLSEPRIFFWPMSLALLIDLALHEFPDQDSTKFRAEDFWHHLVREQESLILQPFYQKCVDIIKDYGRENQTLADAFYVV